MTTVRDIIEKLHENNNLTFHKALGNNVEILSRDWFRVYRGGDCIIYDMLFSCFWKDIDSVPEEILDTNIDMYNTWMIGGDLSCDCIILEDKFRKEYMNDDRKNLFV